MTDEVRARALLGAPELEWLVDRLAERVRRGGILAGKVRLEKPNEAQRAAFARLTGGYGRGEGLVVDLERLTQQLRDAGVASSLEAAVCAIRGPLVNRLAQAAAAEAEWEAVLGALDGEDWGELRRSGLIKRLAGDPAAGRLLIDSAVRVLGCLPATGMPLAELAAVTGDAHALDAGRALATLVLRVVRARTGVDPADRRLAWASVGIECDPLSVSALVLGVRSHGGGLLARLLADCAPAGEPCRLTLRQLRGGLDVDLDLLFVCENPAVVAAAADRLGPRCRPLLCVEGQPGSAARVLLDSAGPRVRYHGDFDWPGLRIGAEVLTRTGGRPWRFDAVAYAAATKGVELSGPAFVAPWDPALSAAMEACGRAVHEEAVLDALIGDLAVG